jgi:hypothetical protein
VPLGTAIVPLFSLPHANAVRPIVVACKVEDEDLSFNAGGDVSGHRSYIPQQQQYHGDPSAHSPQLCAPMSCRAATATASAPGGDQQRRVGPDPGALQGRPCRAGTRGPAHEGRYGALKMYVSSWLEKKQKTRGDLADGGSIHRRTERRSCMPCPCFDRLLSGLLRSDV